MGETKQQQNPQISNFRRRPIDECVLEIIIKIILTRHNFQII